MNQAIKLKKKSLEDKEVISVIKKMVRQHQDSIEQFKQGRREDLVDKETQELEILNLRILTVMVAYRRMADYLIIVKPVK